MKPMKVSVVIPALNEEKYLPRLLNSLSAQHGWEWGRDFEVIVSDDGSTDATIEVAKSYGCRVVEWPNKPSGPGAARNRGASMASSPVLLFVDADVMLGRNFLDEFWKDMAGSDMVVYSMKSEGFGIFEPFFAVASYMFMFLTMLGRPMTPGFCMGIRRDVFLKAEGFPEHVSMGEDIFLGMKVHSIGRRIIYSAKSVAVSPRKFRNRDRYSYFLNHTMNFLIYVFTSRVYCEM